MAQKGDAARGKKGWMLKIEKGLKRKRGGAKGTPWPSIRQESMGKLVFKRKGANKSNQGGAKKNRTLFKS